MKRLLFLVLAVTLAWSSTSASTRALPASGKAAKTTTKAAQTATTAVQVIDLGKSAVYLERGWRFHPGDSPWVNGSPLWTQPGYSDAGWAGMNLVPKTGSVDMLFGTTGYVPGWTARGYPRLSGYAWYRLRVRVTHPGQPLWLKMPIWFNDAFELYANGRYVGQFGSPSRKGSLVQSQPVSFALPKPGPGGDLTLALRFYQSPASLVSPGDLQGSVGGLQGPPAVGQASTVKLMQATEKGSLLRSQMGGFFLVFLCLLTAPLALWAWVSDRKTRLWLWLFLMLSSIAALTLALALWNLSSDLPAGVFYAIRSVSPAGWSLSFVLFFWYWFRLEEKRWIAHTGWLLAGTEVVAFFLLYSTAMGFDFVPVSALPWCAAGAQGTQVGLNLLLIPIFIEGFRRDRIDALLPSVIVPSALFINIYPYIGRMFHIPYIVYFFGLGVALYQVLAFLIILIISALSLRRFMKTQVREAQVREALHRDLEDAQELQQRVLVPEVLDSSNFTVEAEYHPAQKVGGDFFQTVMRSDGTLLVVIGDVSGKGVSAAMLVAVLVGTIRNQAEHSFDPREMLRVLNRRMMGRSGGHFATCLAAEIAPDGVMRIANAGHLPPYLNGAEMELEGALPLGLAPDAEYGMQTVELKSGDRLTFITDGVVEAQNEAKELFGFERAQEVSLQGAAAIAALVKGFGQEDDITVLGVAFAAG